MASSATDYYQREWNALDTRAFGGKTNWVVRGFALLMFGLVFFRIRLTGLSVETFIFLASLSGVLVFGGLMVFLWLKYRGEKGGNYIKYQLSSQGLVVGKKVWSLDQLGKEAFEVVSKALENLDDYDEAGNNVSLLLPSKRGKIELLFEDTDIYKKVLESLKMYLSKQNG